MLWRTCRAGLPVLALLFTAACGAGPTSSGSGGTAAAAGSTPQSAAAFYAHKTLTIIVPFSPGGGYDRLGRLLAKYIQKPLGVGNVVVKNEPGGGGVVGTNDLYRAKPDGLTIGETDGGGDVLDVIFHAPGIAFDPSKFNWLGRPDNEVSVVVVGPAGPGAPRGGYRSFDQLLALKGSNHKVFVLTPGIGNRYTYSLTIMFNTFGIPYHIIAAYKGGSHETTAALLRGDGSVTEFGYTGVRTLIDAGKVRPIAQEGLHRWKVLSHVPTVLELAQKNGVSAAKIRDLKGFTGIMRMGHTFAAPPDVPAGRLSLLRAAFKAAVTNPAFVSLANKQHDYPQYAGAAVIAKEVGAGLAVAPDLRNLAKSK